MAHKGLDLQKRFTNLPPLGVNVIDFELNGFNVELVSKELNHFGVIADLFRQIGGHSTRFVLFCSF